MVADVSDCNATDRGPPRRRSEEWGHRAESAGRFEFERCIMPRKMDPEVKNLILFVLLLPLFFIAVALTYSLLGHR
jgi:hypothetical protein